MHENGQLEMFYQDLAEHLSDASFVHQTPPLSPESPLKELFGTDDFLRFANKILDSQNTTDYNYDGYVGGQSKEFVSDFPYFDLLDNSLDLFQQDLQPFSDEQGIFSDGLLREDNIMWSGSPQKPTVSTFTPADDPSSFERPESVCSNSSSSSSSSSTASDSSCCSDVEYKPKPFINKNVVTVKNSSLYNNSTIIPGSALSDHSYQKPNIDVQRDGLGIQTPSDSEGQDEEIIDVESIGRSSQCLSPPVEQPVQRGRAPRRQPQRRKSARIGYTTITTVQPKRALPSKPTSRTEQQMAAAMAKVKNNELRLQRLISTQKAPAGNATKKCNKVQPNKRRAAAKIVDDYDDDVGEYRRPVQNKRGKQCGVEFLLKRKEHNVLERRRRTDMKGLFQVLRTLVPELVNNERASKVQILNKCRDFILKVKSDCDRFERQKKEEINKHQALQRKLRTYK